MELIVAGLCGRVIVMKLGDNGRKLYIHCESVGESANSKLLK